VEREHFNSVVVGSGFGGSVSAYRLAEAGRSVCLLERGKPFPPGSFPRSPHGLSKNFWDPSEGLHGMFNVWSFRGIDALVSSGLGGGSLIYANVMIRKDERWFVQDGGAPGGERWPVTRADLDAHYDRVERMLDVQKYPLHREPYSETRKTFALKEAAERRGYHWFLPNLAVTFANDGEEPAPGEPIKEEHPNLHGRTRYTCRLVGECDVGCNYGSKNTLDYTYLSHAQRLGADVRTRCEVRAFRPREGGGFEIDYVHHDERAEGHKTETRRLPVQTVTANHLIVSAGTLGSTYLLLANRRAFGGLPDALGTRFCGNGDLLTFAVNCRDHSLEQRSDGRSAFSSWEQAMGGGFRATRRFWLAHFRFRARPLARGRTAARGDLPSRGAASTTRRCRAGEPSQAPPAAAAHARACRGVVLPPLPAPDARRARARGARVDRRWRQLARRRGRRRRPAC